MSCSLFVTRDGQTGTQQAGATVSRQRQAKRKSAAASTSVRIPVTHLPKTAYVLKQNINVIAFAKQIILLQTSSLLINP